MAATAPGRAFLLPRSRNVSLRRSSDPTVSAAVEPASRLALLGGFSLETGAGRLVLPLHAQRLVAFLALQRRPVHRAYVAGRLWIDHDQDHAHGCLRTTIWRVGLLSHSVVQATSTQLTLDPAIAVDVQELEACADRILETDAVPAKDDVHRLVRATELLPDWYDDWIPQERERLRQLRLLALEAAGCELLGARRYADATIAALAAIGVDPLRESAYALLIRSYLGLGNVAEALRQFRAFRNRLQQELGLYPSSKIQDLLPGLE
jgi:DNA-binding SARP family transcriptional activator